MPDSEPDVEPEADNDPLYDNWPIERYDEGDQWRERETPADDDALDEVAEDYEAEMDEEDVGVEWIGVSGWGAPLLYEPHGPALYEGELDEENERVILRKADREELDEDESLGERIEEFGEEHGWKWLSSFARDHLEDDEREVTYGPVDAPASSPDELALRSTEFQERNVAETEDEDLSYFGSHTLVDDAGWVHIVEREFDVFADDADETGRVEVRVDEEFLVAEESSARRRAGDADLIAERDRELEFEVDTDELGWENLLADEIERWHESHVEWPEEEE